MITLYCQFLTCFLGYYLLFFQDMPKFKRSLGAVSCCFYWGKVFCGVQVLGKFHQTVTILSVLNVDLKLWHSRLTICDAMGCRGMSHLNQGNSIDSVCWVYQLFLYHSWIWEYHLWLNWSCFWSLGLMVFLLSQPVPSNSLPSRPPNCQAVFFLKQFF